MIVNINISTHLKLLFSSDDGSFPREWATPPWHFGPTTRRSPLCLRPDRALSGGF